MVSILLPFFNMEQWIQETIESIQMQSFEDWELICIDDFSTDRSNEIVRTLQRNDSRIQLHQNQEKGIIPALQHAFSLSSGIFISRMDADDLMPPKRLLEMTRRLETSPPKTIVTGKVQYFSDLAVSEGYLEYENWLNDRVTNNDHWKHIFRECVIASPNWMARQEDLLTDRIFEELKYPEDYDMTFQWKTKGYSIASIPSVTLLWREHPYRTSRNSDIYQQASFFHLKLDWFLRTYKTDSIGILGAGPKGKLAANHLISNEKSFNWYDYKFKNYAAGLLEQPILDFELINDTFLLVAIYPKDLSKLEDFLIKKGYIIGRNAWYL